jgi:Peptidase C65 Otubain.
MHDNVQADSKQRSLQIDENTTSYFNIVDVPGDGNCFYRALLCHSSFQNAFSDYGEFRQKLGTSILTCIDGDHTRVR